MSTAAQLKTDAMSRSPQTQKALQPRVAPPANDTRTVRELPQFALTEKSRAKFDAAAARINPSRLKPLPPYASDRLRWMGGILASAWVDQHSLAGVSIGGGAAVSVAELEDFGHCIAYVREVIGASGLVVATTVALSDEDLKRRTREAQVKLCGAIPLWLEGKDGAAVSQARRTVRSVMGARAEKHLSQNTVKLLSVIDEHAGLEVWLRTLPREEGASHDDLRTLHPELVRREQLSTRERHEGREDDTRSERAWALLGPSLRRILLAGRYLTKGRADRAGAYPGFARPKVTKPRAKKVAPVQPVKPA